MKWVRGNVTGRRSDGERASDARGTCGTSEPKSERQVQTARCADVFVCEPTIGKKHWRHRRAAAVRVGVYSIAAAGCWNRTVGNKRDNARTWADNRKKISV